MARHLPAIIVALTLSTACLLKDTAETWYLTANGAVTWVVTESDVRSDAQAAVDRQSEEETYRLALDRQDHPVARAFHALGLSDIRTVALRRDVPFTVRTEARGLTIGELGLRILQRAGLAGNSTLVHAGNTWTWTFTARDPHAPDVTGAVDENVASLIGDLDRLNVVMVDGRFDAASGFELSADHRVATLKESERRDDAFGTDDQSVTLRLTWAGGSEIFAAPTSSPSRRR